MISTSSNKIDEIVAPDEIETYVSMPFAMANVGLVTRPV